MKLKCLIIAIWLFGLQLFPCARAGADLAQQRMAFLQTEKLIAEKKEAEFLEASAKLVDYPLYPYLRYQWQKENLSQTDRVLAFLSAYKDTRFAAPLRSRWLDYLAEQGRWQDFVRNYLKDENSGDDCQWLWARYQTGEQQAALTEAKRLWLSGSVEKDCAPLFSVLEKSPALSPESVWQRFETVITSNHFETAKAASVLLEPPERKVADNWLQLHQKPDLVTDNKFWQAKAEPRTARLFAHAIKRLANSDLDKALAVWDNLRNEFAIDAEASQAVERKFGMELLGDKDSRAYARLAKASPNDADTRAGKIRAALLEQNWPHVNKALADLNASERQEPKWQYWQARAWQETGGKQQAHQAYKKLANDRSFYGFLAAEVVDVPYRIVDVPITVDDDAVKSLAEQSDFVACQEFKLLSRELEFRRQWQFAIKNLPKAQLLTAAKLAQQRQWLQQAITTLVKADYWDDMALRFPVAYLAEVQAASDKYGLGAALLYGLMRQESMLDPNAESSAGAKGLMQLMPETAMKIAKSLQLPWQSANDLYKPDVNINYAGHYFRDLLGQFNNHIAVAGAAYNAGPNRAKKWLPIVATVPADIWMETIPYKETRKYVTTVLAYAIIYQHRLNKGNLKLRDLLPDIAPTKN